MSFFQKKYFIISFIIVGLVSHFFLNSYIQALIISFLINAIMAMSQNFITGVANQFSLGSAGFMALGAYTSAILIKEFFQNYPSTITNQQKTTMKKYFIQLIQLLHDSDLIESNYKIILDNTRYSTNQLTLDNISEEFIVYEKLMI